VIQPLPVPVEKEAYNSIVKRPSILGQEFDMKDFFDEIIEIVHGSALTKAELAKELAAKLPQLKRKSERIKQFLSTYCDRGRD